MKSHLDTRCDVSWRDDFNVVRFVDDIQGSQPLLSDMDEGTTSMHYHAIIEKRTVLFANTAKTLVVTGLLFYVLAFIHPNSAEIMPRVVSIATAFIACALLTMNLARRKMLTFAINFLSASSALLMTVGIILADKMGPNIWFFSLTFSLASFHLRSRHVIYLYLFTSACVLLVWTQVAADEPIQIPAFFVLLTTSAIMVYFSTRISSQNLHDMRDMNDVLFSTNRELAVARKQADAASDAKSLFLATMSHELRTPLNAVIGYSEMIEESLEEDDFSAQDRAQSLRDLAQIQQAGKHLLGLVSSVLDLTRLESGEMQLELTTFSLEHLLERAYAAVKPIADQKELVLTLDAELHDTADAMCQDSARVEQVLMNLLTNALKFTTKGHVVLKACMQDADVLIEVRDTGKGVELAHQERIFELFTQLDSSYTREADGVGIGLFLCKKIAQALGGDLWLESELGKGSSFFFLLPVKCLADEG